MHPRGFNEELQLSCFLWFFMVYFSICCIYFSVSVSDQVFFYWYWPHYPVLYLLLQLRVFWYHGVSCYAFLIASLALGASHPTVFSSAKASVSWNWPMCCWAVIFLVSVFSHLWVPESLDLSQVPAVDSVGDCFLTPTLTQSVMIS